MRKMALVCLKVRYLSTSGDIRDRQCPSDFVLVHIGRCQDAKLQKAALGSKLEWLVSMMSLYFSAAA